MTPRDKRDIESKIESLSTHVNELSNAIFGVRGEGGMIRSVTQTSNDLRATARDVKEETETTARDVRKETIDIINRIEKIESEFHAIKSKVIGFSIGVGLVSGIAGSKLATILSGK